MTFKTPAPRFFIARLAKDKDVVGLGVSNKTAIFPFQHEEDVLKKHDVLHLCVARFAQHGLEEGVCQYALLVVHLLDLESLPAAALEHFCGDKMPVGTLSAVEFKCG